jgi:tripartite-type tricarboxylate transporter receptor subunit TctC
LRFALLAVASLFAVPSIAQIYPSMPVRLIVPFPPGGGADFMGRIMALAITGAKRSTLLPNMPIIARA